MDFSFWYAQNNKYASFPAGGHALQGKSATWNYVTSAGVSDSTTKVQASGGLITFTTPNYPSQPSQQTAVLTLHFASGNTCDKLYVAKIRLKIDNSASSGGVRYSGECICTLEDQTGSWIVSALDHTWSQLELSRLFRFKTWSYRHKPYETAIYRGPLGRELVRRMVKKSADFESMKKRVIIILNTSMTMNHRFECYRALIKECFITYWPDCPDQYVQTQLDTH